MIEAAIVGVGRWGRNLVESVASSSRIRFTTAVARTPARAAEFCAAHGLRLTDDYASVLGDPRVDAVVLATPHSTHYQQIVRAAQSRKHVFCEKPFTMTRAEADTALGALAHAGLIAGVGFNRRYAPNTLALRRMIAGGELGDRIHIEGQFSADLSGAANAWRGDPGESPAGGMTSLGIHLVDAFLDLFGPVSALEARSQRIALPFDVDDSTRVLLDFENGATGYLGTVASSALGYGVRAFGTRGWAEIRDTDRLEYALTSGERDQKSWAGQEYPGLASIRDGLEAFADAVSGAAPYPIPPRDILHGNAVLDAIIAGAETGTRQIVR